MKPSPVACFFSLIVVVLFLSGCNSLTVRNAEIEATPLTLIPLPVESNSHASSIFHVYENDLITCDSVFINEAHYLADQLKMGESRPKLGIPAHPSAIIRLVYDSKINTEEGYELSVSASEITIRAFSPKGAFYGIQTLMQLEYTGQASPENTHSFLHAEIIDQPRFSHRGLLLDCCRHFMETDFIKRYIDLLARYKMNVFHWHLTEDQGWRFESHRYPLLTEVGAWRKTEDGQFYGGFYSKEEMREVVNYAAERHITVIPEIELPGHSSAAIASYPWLSCTGDTIPVETEWGVFKDIYCAGSDTTLRFLETILDEVIEIFPSEIIHIGGDEAPKIRWEQCEKCQKRIQNEGLKDEHELQSWMISHFANYLKARKRRLIGWDEILDGGLPAGCLVQSWRGTEGGVTAAKLGQDAVMSPTSHAYFDYDVKAIDLEKVYSFEPVPEELSTDEARHIIGGECNMWSERAPQHSIDSKVFPRILAMAEVLWSPAERRDFAAFKQRVNREYPRLDALGVEYGMETVPASIHGQMNGNELQIHVERKVDDLRMTYRFDNDPWQDLPNDGVIDATYDRAVFALLCLKTDGSSYGDTLFQPIANHLALAQHVKLNHPPSQYYPGKSVNALTDGLIGTYDFRDGNWQGFSGDDLIATIELKEIATISSVTIPFYTYSNAWIFMPQTVTIETSLDGKNWNTITSEKNPLEEDDKRQEVVEWALDFKPQATKFIRVHAKNRGVCPPWHDAPGESAWLFASEIIVGF